MGNDKDKWPNNLPKHIDIRYETMPAGYEDLIAFCRKEYGYEYLGMDQPIRTAMSGVSFRMYFKEKDGETHCLPETGHETTLNRHVQYGKKPIFAW
jgi:hypothetical protein